MNKGRRRSDDTSSEPARVEPESSGSQHAQSAASDTRSAQIGAEARSETAQHEYATAHSLEQYERLVDRAHREIEGVRSVYIWLAGCLAVIFAFGLSWFLYLNGSSLKEMRQDADDSVRDIKADVNDTLLSMQSWLDEQVTEMSARVNRRIEREFNEPSIHGLMETSARESVEKVAVPLIESGVETRVSLALDPVEIRIADAHKLVADLQDSLAKAEQEQTVLQRELGVLRLFFSVRGGDRAAFMELQRVSVSADEPDRTLAMSLMDEIAEYYESLRFSIYHQVVMSKATGRPTNPPAETIYAIMKNASLPRGQRMAHINEIDERKLYYLIEDLVTIVKDDEDLRIAAEAARVICEVTDESLTCSPPFESILNWWTSEGKQAERYRSPFEIIREYSQLYGSGQKDEALHGFLRIVETRKGLAAVRHVIAQIYADRGEFDKAVEQLRAVHRESQGHLPSALFLVHLLIKQEKKSEAVNVIKLNIVPFVAPEVDIKAVLQKDVSLKPLYDQKEFRELAGIDPNDVRSEGNQGGN